MSTTGLAPVTVIVSSSEPICMSPLTVAVNPVVSSTPSRLTVEKPGQGERHAVDARPQVQNLVLPLIVGDRRLDLLDERRARRFDRHARQHRSGRIAHDAGDGARGSRLRARHRGQQQGTARLHLTQWRDTLGTLMSPLSLRDSRSGAISSASERGCAGSGRGSRPRRR